MTGVSRPFTCWAPSRTVSTATFSALTVASEATVSPLPASCCSRWQRLTVSPTRVYSSRSAEQDRVHGYLQRPDRGLGGHGLALACQLLQPLAEINGVPDQGVLQPLRRAGPCPRLPSAP